jgi:predicted metal-dependent hydrolase
VFPAPESSQIHYGTTLLDYRIRRSDRRTTVSIAVVPEEGLVVTAPKRATKSRLDELVHRKGAWILQRLKHQRDLPAPIPTREFVNGETYAYLGRQYRLKVVEKRDGDSVSLHGAYLELSTKHRVGARTAIVAWYRAKAASYLPRRAATWAPKLGLDVPRIHISEPQQRWGSAGKDGVLRINWRILQAPTALVDYVIVHELTHLIHENHGRDFWATLGRVMPDYEERKRRLRALGPGLVW